MDRGAAAGRQHPEADRGRRRRQADPAGRPGGDRDRRLRPAAPVPDAPDVPYVLELANRPEPALHGALADLVRAAGHPRAARGPAVLLRRGQGVLQQLLPGQRAQPRVPAAHARTAARALGAGAADHRPGAGRPRRLRRQRRRAHPGRPDDPAQQPRAAVARHRGRGRGVRDPRRVLVPGRVPERAVVLVQLRRPAVRAHPPGPDAAGRARARPPRRGRAVRRLPRGQRGRPGRRSGPRPATGTEKLWA